MADNKDYTKSDHVADRKAEDERSTQNNANNIRNAADVAIASKNPYAMAAGAAVKAADKITGGKSTEALGKGMTRANKMAPGGKKIQNASNKLMRLYTSSLIPKNRHEFPNPNSLTSCFAAFSPLPPPTNTSLNFGSCSTAFLKILIKNI